MKTLLTLAAGLVLVTLGTGNWRAAAAAQEPHKPVPQEGAEQGSEARLAALEAKLAALEKKNDETRKLVEETVTYLEKHGKAAQTLTTALDQCKEQGFAVGENWKSRETLLEGLRAYLAEGQAGLPKLPATPPAPKPAPAQRPKRQ
jgi:uncharacterized coiled-coil protein SlyX